MRRRHPLWHNWFRAGSAWTHRAARLCAANALFEGLPRASIDRLVREMHHRSYSAGETIFAMGHPGAGAVLILEGEVRIEAGGVELAHLGEGDLFGEVALVNEQPRTANAVAVTDCELLFFLRSDLEEWMEHQPRLAGRLAMNLASMLAVRLLEANRRLAESGTGS